MINVLIADDHPMLRDGLRKLIAQQEDLRFAGEADSGRTAVELACRLQPHVAVLDAMMPALNGVEAARQIAAACPAVRTVVLFDEADAQQVRAALAAGAAGAVSKNAPLNELLRAVRTAADGRTYLSPDVATTVVRDMVGRGQRSSVDDVPAAALSDREREVLQGLAEGRSVKAIAAALFVSPKTVETHRRNLMTKARLESIADLIRYALRQGVTSMEV